MSKFNNDIAIIYPQHEDSSLSEADQIWVSEFKRYLEASLHQLLDTNVQVVDIPLKPGSNLIDNLMNENASLICIISPDYLKVDNYNQQMEEIYELQKNEPENRLFHVVKYPVDAEAVPEWLQYKPQYAFYDKKPNTRKYIELDFSRDINESHAIWHKLTDLVYDIHNSLKSLNIGDDHADSNHQISIFVAETTPDQEENRNKIIRELKQKGVNVFPKHTLPNRAKEIEPILKSILDKCSMSIHLMGGLYGSYLKDSRYSISDYLNRTVREYIQKEELENRRFKRIIWLPPYLKISDQRQDLFLGRLKREENDSFTELIQSPLEELKSLIFRNITNFIDNSDKNLGKVSSVYVIHDPLHISDLNSFYSFLQERAIRVLSLSFDNGDSIIKQHIDNLIHCDSVVIINNNNQHWLEAKLRDIIKVKGYGRTRPFTFKAVISESDDGQFKLDDNITKDVTFLRDDKNLTSNLEPLLQKMEVSHA